MFPNIFGNTEGSELMFRPHLPSSDSNVWCTCCTRRCGTCTVTCGVRAAEGDVERATNGFNI